MNLYPKDKTALLVLLTVSAIALLVSNVLNIVMPVSWRWLSPDDLSGIKPEFPSRSRFYTESEPLPTSLILVSRS